MLSLQPRVTRPKQVPAKNLGCHRKDLLSGCSNHPRILVLPPLQPALGTAKVNRFFDFGPETRVNPRDKISPLRGNSPSLGREQIPRLLAPAKWPKKLAWAIIYNERT